MSIPVAPTLRPEGLASGLAQIRCGLQLVRAATHREPGQRERAARSRAIRALDYLETRPEVDKSRIGLTGISGGGAMTWYTAAVDERISAAAPVCSTFTFGSQAEYWLARGQCDCIYYHNT